MMDTVTERGGMEETASESAYKAVRERVALINLSSEGRLRLSGVGAEAVLDRLFSQDLGIVARWRGISGLFLHDDASLVAIATVFKGDDECYVFTEANTAPALYEHLRSHLVADDVLLEDLSSDYDWWCLVGPNAQKVAADVAGDDVLGMRYLSFEQNPVLDVPLFRMGYSGEYEYRLLCPKQQSEALTQRLMISGRDSGIALADPAVFPLLMLEMRSLCRKDIPAGMDPLAMGMHWMVSFRKHAYPGAEALRRMKFSLDARALMLILEEPGIAAAGDRLQIEDSELGICAAVQFSPTLGKDIALACVDPAYGWVGVRFSVVGPRGSVQARGVSAPLFVTKTVSAA